MTKIAGSGSPSGSESGSISQRHGSADPNPDPDPHRTGSATLTETLTLPVTEQSQSNIIIAYTIYTDRQLMEKNIAKTEQNLACTVFLNARLLLRPI